MPESDEQRTGGGELDPSDEVEEVACEEATDATLAGDAAPVEDETTLSPDEERELDESLAEADEEGERAEHVRGLGAAGGGWGGSQAPVQRAMRIGTRNGLTITSNKRSSGNSGSDHHVSQRRSYAADMSNGRSPTPQMDRTAAQIAALLGHPGWRGGNLRVNTRGYRVQLLWRTNIGGNHFNHVHVGVRML